MPKSPDRIDALVWALTELNTGSSSMIALSNMATFCPSCRFRILGIVVFLLVVQIVRGVDLTSWL